MHLKARKARFSALILRRTICWISFAALRITLFQVVTLAIAINLHYHLMLRLRWLCHVTSRLVTELHSPVWSSGDKNFVRILHVPVQFVQRQIGALFLWASPHALSTIGSFFLQRSEICTMASMICGSSAGASKSSSHNEDDIGTQTDASGGIKDSDESAVSNGYVFYRASSFIHVAVISHWSNRVDGVSISRFLNARSHQP